MFVIHIQDFQDGINIRPESRTIRKCVALYQITNKWKILFYTNMHINTFSADLAVFCVNLGDFNWISKTLIL